MIKPHHKKIAIIGNAGSGKTTLAFELHKKLHLPLYHLDQYYWLPQWQRIDYEEFCKIHDELCKTDAWIMEGSYYRLLYTRILHADVIIFLDMPRYLCMWRVIKRTLFNLGQVIPGSPQNKQQLFSFDFLRFLRWVWNFNNRYRRAILNMLGEYKSEKQIYILNCPDQLTDFFNCNQ